MGWLKDRLYTLWGAWSAIQDREDEVWEETINGKSEQSTEPEAGCSTKNELVPELSELIARRNEEVRKNSH